MTDNGNHNHDEEPVPLHILEAELQSGYWDDPWDLPAPTTRTVTATTEPLQLAHDETSWAPINLAQLFDGNYQPPTPELFARTDGQPILYQGKAHAFNGPPESGKSWAALTCCVQAVNDGHHTIYVDFEDTAPTVVTRLLALGADPDAIVQRLTYLSPSEPLWFNHKLTVGGQTFASLLEQRHFTLAVVDGVTEAMNVHGLDTNSNNDAATYYGILPRRLQLQGAATVQIDHKPKNNKESRGGIGAQHKLAGLDVSFRFDVLAPFGVGQHGIARIVIEKDRPGQHRQHAIGAQHDRLAEFHLINNNQALTAELRPIETPDTTTSGFRPTVYMKRVSDFVADCNANDNYPSQRMIEDGVTGKGDYVRQAIAELVREGYMQKGGPGRSITQHTLLTPFEDEDE